MLALCVINRDCIRSRHESTDAYPDSHGDLHVGGLADGERMVDELVVVVGRPDVRLVVAHLARRAKRLLLGDLLAVVCVTSHNIVYYVTRTTFCGTCNTDYKHVTIQTTTSERSSVTLRRLNVFANCL